MKRKNVRRVYKEIRSEKISFWIADELVQILLQLPSLGPPGEVRVGLSEAQLGQSLHERRPGKRLGQEDHVRMQPLNLLDQPLPKLKWLGVRIVHPEDTHALGNPKKNDIAQRFPYLNRLRRGEIRVDDVFIPFRRVF